MVDLSIPGACRLLAEQIRGDIDAACTKPGKYAWRIKPSVLGGPCVARMWYDFRWARRRETPPRIQRIFDTGHSLEELVIHWLRLSGWQIFDRDPARAEKQKQQWNFKALDGHISAYLDGIGTHSVRTPGLWGNIEAKSYNRKNFNMLVNKTHVKVVDYEYYVQACIYMKGYGLPFTALVAVCKDDGDMHVDVFLRDDETADRALATAHTIKTSRARPARVAESPAYHLCKGCTHVGVCHLGEKPDVNCRSCVHAVAIEGGKFGCSKFNAFIPDEQSILNFPTMCGGYEAIA